MKILGIDTSGKVASVALIEDEKLICEKTLNYKLTHSQTLMPMIDELCKSTELDLNTLDAIAIANGPGSFTGLRIGSATAKGLAHGLNKPIIPVSTLDGLAYNIPYFNGVICPIMDARRKQVYTALYTWKDKKFKCLTEYMAVPIKEIIDKIKAEYKKVIFLGDGVPVFKEIIKENFNDEECYFAPAYCNRQRASVVATLGMEYFKKGIKENYLEHAPFYLRKSQAEREYENKNLISK